MARGQVVRGAEMQVEQRPADDSIAILNQAIVLLEQISDQSYTQVDTRAFKACVGTHMRHIFDFYGCFFRGLPLGKIDYDLRKREPLLEQSRSTALARLHGLIEQLDLMALDGDASLLVRQDTSAPAEDPAAWSRSSVLRELQSLVSHTIHHYALIAVMLRQQGFEPDAAFGVAPSTLLRWRSS